MSTTNIWLDTENYYEWMFFLANLNLNPTNGESKLMWIKVNYYIYPKLVFSRHLMTSFCSCHSNPCEPSESLTIQRQKESTIERCTRKTRLERERITIDHFWIWILNSKRLYYKSIFSISSTNWKISVMISRLINAHFFVKDHYLIHMNNLNCEFILPIS